MPIGSPPTLPTTVPVLLPPVTILGLEIVAPTVVGPIRGAELRVFDTAFDPALGLKTKKPKYLGNSPRIVM